MKEPKHNKKRASLKNFPNKQNPYKLTSETNKNNSSKFKNQPAKNNLN